MNPLQHRLLLLAACASACLLFWAVSMQDVFTNARIKNISSYISGSHSPSHGSNSEGLAYMTFLANTVANKSDPNPEHDHYYEATRILGYQLLHQPETRTQRNIPFVVLVTEDISEEKRERLRLDGATVIPVEYIRGYDWIVGGMPEWRDVLTKLQAWKLTQYSRVTFLDGDMILNRCMDGIFDDPATQFRETDLTLNEEPALPSRYLLASIPETEPVHASPPTDENGGFKDVNYFNAGFFLFGPSMDVFEHYKYFMDHEMSFDPQYPEQNLLNHAHRRGGGMPWQRMDDSWNIRFPNKKDLEQNVASMHDKWWHAWMDPALQPYYDSIRWRMEGFYEGYEPKA